MDRVADRVIVTCVWNPFDPLVSRETRLLEARKTVAEYVEVFFPDAVRDGYDLAISINGAVVNTEEVLPLQVKEGLSLAFCLVPRGGGGGKNILRVVAMIALVALAVYTGGATAGALGLTEGSFAAGMVSGIVAGAIVVVGGMVINAILPYQTPKMESIEGSPNYGWEQGTNFLYEAGALPILYGKRRVTPPVIARHIESVAGENNQYLSVLMALCEGALQTVPSNDADALRNNIRINRVKASNYSGVTAEARRGVNTEADGQALIQDFNATYTDTAVGIKLTDNVNWITRTTSGNAVEMIGVNFSCPGGLGAANDNGGLNTVYLRIQVEYKKQGDSVWTRIQDYNVYPITVTTGRWSKGYYDEFGNWIEVEAGSGTPGDHYENEPATWTVTYGLGTVDGVDSFVQTGLWHWIVNQTVSGIGTVNQDHIAFAAATTSALRKGWKQSVAPGTYDIRVRLEDAYQTGAGVMADCYWDFYTEAVPDDFIYPNTALLAIRALATNQLSGSFPTIDIEIDRGDITLPTFGAKPSSNPAWACVDLLTNTRYGAGVPIAKIDTTAFQAWADFCTTNSYTCNLYIDQTISVRQALNMISQLGRGTVIQLGSRFTVIVDKAEGTPVQRFLFNVGNIVQDSFKEQWLSQDDRANAIEVEYYDEDLNYERTALTLYAEDFDTTALEIKQASIVLYGCTDREMAIKHGKFLLNCNRYLTLTAQWDCDIDALACFPGDIVEVQHDIPQWGVGGRVVSSTANSVTLDRPVTIGAGTWHIRVKHQDDDTFEEKTITDGAGTYTTLNISGTWTKNPAQYALYSVGLINFVVKLFRILRISRANDLRRRITAIEYYEPVYSDSATVPAPTPFPDPVFVSNLKAAEIYKEGSIAGVALSWTGYATPFRIFVKRAGETTYRFLGEALGNSFESWGFDTGVAYTFLVTPASSPSGSDGATVTITIQGHASVPTIADPVFIDARCTYTDKIQLVWEPIDDTLLGYFEVRTDLNWGTADANLIYQGKATTFTMKPGGASYTFYIKSHDTFGNYSAGYDSITLTQTVPAPVFVSIDSSKFGRVRIEWEPLNDEYYDSVEIWRSTTNDRTTASLVGAIHGNVYSDTNVAVATQYYYWLRTKSIFGTYSAWSTGDTAGHGAMTARINTADLADAIITSMKLAPEIVTPEVVNSLPTLPDAAYPEGKIVYLTTDGKLYRNDQSGGGAETVDYLDAAASNSQSSTLAYTVGAGSHRYLIVAISQEAADLTAIPTVSYGGQSMTQLVTAYADGAGNDTRVTIFGLNNAGIAAASGNTISVDTNSVAEQTIIARSFSGVNQTTPIPETDTDNAPAGTPNPLLLTIAAGDGSAVLSVSGNSDPGDGTWGADLTERIEQASGTSMDSSMADVLVASATTIDANCTWTNCIRAAAAAVEIAPFPGSGGWSAEVAVDDLDRLIEGADIAVNTIATQHLVVANFDNLMANGNSEAGVLAVSSPENTNLVNEPANAYAGDWCRKWIAGTDAWWDYFAPNDERAIQAAKDEEFYFSTQVKVTSGGSTFRLYIIFRDASGANVNVEYTEVECTSSYQKVSVSGKAGAGTTMVVFSFNAVDAGTYYIDEMFARRKSGADLIVDGAITTDKIIANAVTTGKIAAGAVGADEIAANVIAVKHLVVADYSNMIWEPHQNAAVKTNSPCWTKWTTGNSVQTVVFSGAAPTNIAYRVDGPSAAWYNDHIFAVAPGDTYHVSAKITPSGAGIEAFYIWGRAVLGNVNSVAWPFVNFSSNTYNGNNERASGIITMPASATTCQIVLGTYETQTGYWLFGDPICRKAAGGEMIVDGAITAAKVGANEIIAQSANLKDAVIGTLKIAGNAITIPVGAETLGITGCNSNITDPTNIVQATINAEGSPIKIDVSGFVFVPSGTTAHFGLYEDGSVMDLTFDVPGGNGVSWVPLIRQKIYTPTSGNHTYSLRGWGVNSPYVSFASISLLGCKR